MLKMIRACIGCDEPEDLWLNQDPPVTEIVEEGVNKFAMRKSKLKHRKTIRFQAQQEPDDLNSPSYPD